MGVAAVGWRAVDEADADRLAAAQAEISHGHPDAVAAVQAVARATIAFRSGGAEVEIVGMNEASETIVDRLAMHDKPGAMDKLLAH